MKKKTILIISIALSAVFIASYYIFFRSEYVEYEKYKSPDENYTVVVYIEKSYKRFTAITSSQNEYRQIYVKILDKNENVLLDSSSCMFCDMILDDLILEWNMDDNELRVTKTVYIDLNKFKLSCCL